MWIIFSLYFVYRTLYENSFVYLKQKFWGTLERLSSLEFLPMCFHKTSVEIFDLWNTFSWFLFVEHCLKIPYLENITSFNIFIKKRKFEGLWSSIIYRWFFEGLPSKEYILRLFFYRSPLMSLLYIEDIWRVSYLWKKL